MQRNWIGRSEGAEVKFQISNPNLKSPSSHAPRHIVRCNLHGACTGTWVGDEITTEEQCDAVENYREHTARKSDLERTELAKKNRRVHWRLRHQSCQRREDSHLDADYVLASYGTGAIMACLRMTRGTGICKEIELPIRAVVMPSVDCSNKMLPTIGRILNLILLLSNSRRFQKF